MKKGLLLIAVTFLSLGLVSAKIRNGYETKLAAARVSLRQLQTMLRAQPDMARSKKQKVTSEIKAMLLFLSCYELTEKLLMQLRTISPGIYNELDTIKDKRGRPTDVYVRLVLPATAGVPLEGVSIFSQAPFDEDANYSEYGNYSVSISVWIVDKSLLLLCHELGHARYVIPNLAEYFRFYQKCYGIKKNNLSYVGHNIRDESGKLADAFVRQYIRDKANFKRESGRQPESTFAILRRIEKNNRRLREEYVADEAVASKVNR